MNILVIGCDQVGAALIRDLLADAAAAGSGGLRHYGIVLVHAVRLVLRRLTLL